ncbi:MAG: DNA-binding response regulator [Roseiflexus castenholzii]|uniref:response regulator transcription factor n=1 Tax=Roseiflexus castenholzii TaxID=120962 RepID=UPI000CA9F598|nr:MAG: DNA-binding response regulator [Roseiflexus castenholzii]
MAATILVVEDEEPILNLVVAYLKADGFAVHTAREGESALMLAQTLQPDLIVLDLLLPGMDGLEICRRLQRDGGPYVLMLTARAEEVDKVVGLSVGADDYLTKPFSPRELVARVKAILRRRRHTSVASPAESALLTFRDLQIDVARREVQRRGVPVTLTAREFDLLYTLAAMPGRVFTREQLLERVWGHDFDGVDRVVDVHISLLRRKLEDDPTEPTLIQTVRGVGYKFTG